MALNRACLLAVILGLAAATADRGAVAHVATVLPAGWRKLDRPVDSNYPLTFQLSLQQSNLAELRTIAHRVSDPKSSSYGKFLSSADLEKLTAPIAAHVAAVEGWLSNSGVAFKRWGETAEVRLTTAQAAKLLDTSFHHAANDVTGQMVVRATDYWLPAEVDDAVAAVYGLHGLPLPARKAIEDPPPAVNVTPAVIETTYGISGVTPSGSEKVRQAVAEFQGQTFDPKDIGIFFEKFVPNATGAGNIHKFVGKGDVGSSGIEAALDVDYIMGVAPGLLTEFWYWGGNDFCADLKNWTNAVLASEAPPLVHSVSYGYQGNITTVLGCKEANVNDIDVNFAKLAAKGISIIFASGDSGSDYDVSGNCPAVPRQKDIAFEGVEYYRVAIDAEGFCCRMAFSLGVKAWTRFTEGEWKGCVLYNTTTGQNTTRGAESGLTRGTTYKLWPSWPASSPWVTSVGSTSFINNRVGQPEMATYRFGSGGGFSSMFEQFKDQVSAVQHYLKIAKGLPNPKSFPSAGRATPDVSALGMGFQVVAGGSVVPGGVGGTSASAPTFAAMVSLLNEARIRDGKPAMGFLNPFLYQNADAFTDITVGTNAINRGGRPMPHGFNCTKGWDPVTGLGTPIFKKMLSAALAAVQPTSEAIVV